MRQINSSPVDTCWVSDTQQKHLTGKDLNKLREMATNQFGQVGF